MVAERAKSLLLLVALALFGSGCIGARTTVVADGSRYPLSLSGSVRDADGTVLTADQLEPTATFHAESTAWGMLYSAAKLTPTTDVSNAVNRALKRTGGDAIVNLRVMSTQCAGDWIPLVNVIPFWPGCANIVIEGDIVRVKRVSYAARSTTPSRIASATLEKQP